MTSRPLHLLCTFLLPAAIHCASISAAERLSRHPAPSSSDGDADSGNSEPEPYAPSSEEGLAAAAGAAADGATGVRGAGTLAAPRAHLRQRDRLRRRSMRGLHAGEGGSAAASPRVSQEEEEDDDDERRRTAPGTLHPAADAPVPAGAAAARLASSAVGSGTGMRLRGRSEEHHADSAAPAAGAPRRRLLPAVRPDLAPPAAASAASALELGSLAGCLDSSPPPAVPTRASLDSSVLLGHHHHVLDFMRRNGTHASGSGTAGLPAAAGSQGATLPPIGRAPAQGPAASKAGQTRLVSRLRSVLRDMFGVGQQGAQ